jgi:hypothetical protein
MLLLAGLLLALLAARVGCVRRDGLDRHAREVAARSQCERIMRALEARRLAPPAAARFAPYEYLSELVRERRLPELESRSEPERDVWSADGYLFHVRLLNRLGRPFPRPPADPAIEPGLGADYELWAWPEDEGDAVLALFFGSDAGYLLQGDVGAYAGLDARPETASNESPAHEIASSGSGAAGRWVTIGNIRGE